MATPTYGTVLNQLNTFIIANGNNEITANVLNPILKLILDFANNTIGNLEDLTTEEKENIVAAINSLKQNINNINTNSVQLYTGVDDPNDTPPASFKYADFYMQLDFVTSEPIKLWQWNGFEWVDSSDFPATQSDNVQNNSDVEGSSVTDALNALAESIEEVNNLLPTFNPTFINPSLSLSLNQATREVGESYSSTMTANFDRGQIRGLIVDGAWNESAFQDFRTGLATSYTLDGITQPNNSRTVTRNLILGNNTFNGSVTFEEGVQPKNNKDANFGNPYPAGILSSSINVLARKKIFHGTGSVPINSAQVRTLSNSVFDTVNNFTINLSTTKYNISIPAEKTLVSVITQNNENITANFTLTTLNVNDAGTGSYSYKNYSFQSAIPLGLTANVILS